MRCVMRAYIKVYIFLVNEICSSSIFVFVSQ